MVSGLETALNEITLVLFTTMAPAGTFALMIMGGRSPSFLPLGSRRYRMVSGLETALNEITLVLFTTMAPAGTFALMIMGAFALKGGLREEARAALDRYTCVPLVIALVGLVASATHLGNPANALYVLAGVGRSPLSNEVVAGVVFFGVAGIYWLTAFSEKPNLSLRRAALVLIEVTGALFVTAIAFAYDAETILTWRTAYVPAALWLNALVAGPIIASLSLYLARYPFPSTLVRSFLPAFSVLACVANAVVYVLQGIDLRGLENSLTSAAQQAPGFLASVPVFVVLSLLAAVIAFAAMRRFWHARRGYRSMACRLIVAESWRCWCWRAC